MTLASVALHWLEQGVPPIPATIGTKIPLVAWRRYQNSLPSGREVARWFLHADRNLALVCGGTKNLMIIDFDDYSLYEKWVIENQDRQDIWREIIDNGYKVRTPRGIHIYIYNEGSCPTYHIPEWKIDIKCGGGIVIAAPSLHPSGRYYHPVPGMIYHANIEDVFPFPEELATYLRIPPPEREHFWLDDLEAECVQNATIAEIKSRVNIAVFVSQYTNLKRTGKDNRFFGGRCINPSHKDNHPSFAVDNGTQRAKCRSGECDLGRNRWLDVIDLYGFLHQVDTGTAIKELTRSYL